MKLTTTFLLEYYDILAFGLRTVPGAPEVRRIRYD
jgi:hypothetical protein